MCAPAIIVCGLWATSVGLHCVFRGFDLTATVLTLFLSINILICCWELILLAYLKDVQEHYQQNYADREVDGFVESGRIFGAKEPHGGFLPRYWASIWSFYARYDRSYIDSRSFGYMADVCNGIFTLIPAVLVHVMITWQAMPARWLGIIMVAMFFQMLYGTFVYFIAYGINRRGRGHSVRELLVFVGMSNSIWIVFPIVGIASGVQLIVTGSYAY